VKKENRRVVSAKRTVEGNKTKTVVGGETKNREEELQSSIGGKKSCENFQRLKKLQRQKTGSGLDKRKIGKTRLKEEQTQRENHSETGTEGIRER